MAGKVLNSSFKHLSKFGASRQESASKTATSHIRGTLSVIVKRQKHYRSYEIRRFWIQRQTPKIKC